MGSPENLPIGSTPTIYMEQDNINEQEQTQESGDNLSAPVTSSSGYDWSTGLSAVPAVVPSMLRNTTGSLRAQTVAGTLRQTVNTNRHKHIEL